MSWNVLIIEDEALVARNLIRQLSEIWPEAAVSGPVQSVQQACHWLQTYPSPDLIFCDIQLTDGVSFEIFQRVPVDVPIIFTTAYDEFAIRAFKLNSIDYLLKPVDSNDLGQAIEKFKRLHAASTPQLNVPLIELLQDIYEKKARKKYKERFLGHLQQRIVPVLVNDIQLFYKDQLIYMVTHEGTELITDYQTLEEIEEVAAPSSFFRANRQHIIHHQSVAHFRNGLNGKVHVQLKNWPSDITISREKAHQFKEWLAYDQTQM